VHNYLFQLIIFGVLIIFNVVQWYQNDHRLKQIDRENRRERDKLIDQILHLSGKTWTPPPSEKDWEPEERANYIISPEQDIPVGE
jgi:hypothetical protein